MASIVETESLLGREASIDVRTIRAQAGVLLACYFGESIIATYGNSILPSLIRGLDIIHGDARLVGFYLGLLQAANAFTTAIAVLFWGALSDRSGRRPVLIACTFGMGIATVLFGFGSTTFSWFLILKVVEGIFRGTKPSVKTSLSDMALSSAKGEDPTKILAWLLSYMPPISATAFAVAPLVAGWAASITVHAKYPYLLACFLSGLPALLAGLILTLSFKETLPARKRDIRTDGTRNTDPPAPSFITRPVIVTLLNYCILAFLDISFMSVFGLFLSTPFEAGGLNMPPAMIGLIMGIGGAFHAIFQALMFTRIYATWRRKTIFAFCTGTSIPVYLLMPLMNSLARRAGGTMTPTVWFLLVLEEVIATAAYSAFSVMYIYITLAAPTPLALGQMHGLAQTMFSLMGAVGPGLANSLIAFFALRQDYASAYLIFAAIGAVSVGVAQLLPSENT